MTLKVVIVDDEKATCDVIKNVAHWEKYNMEVVADLSNGKEVLEFILHHHVDILITDMNMPSMNGGQLLKVITENFKKVKTIVISGYDHFTYLQFAIRAKSIDYLLKPIDPTELNRALEKTAIAIEKRRNQNRLIITESSQNLIPIIQEFKVKLSAVLDNRDIEQLHFLFNQFKSDLVELIHETEKIYAKLYYELVTILEEKVYRYNLSLSDLKLSEIELYLDVEENLAKMLKKMKDIFSRLLKYLIDYKQENSFLQIMDVKDYVDRNYMNLGISLKNIAEEFHITREYLSKLFKESFQVNITEYILKKRMEKAKELIIQDGLEIKRAAEYVGYEDISYFYRVWKKFYGISPRKLKKSKKQN